MIRFHPAPAAPKFRTAALLLSTLLLASVRPATVGAQPAAGSRPLPAFDAAIERAGSVPRLHSLLVSHDGDLVVEQYFNGTDAGTPANIKSASKSVIAALVGIAIARGDISGVDQPIGEFFGDLLNGSPAKAAITVEDLLTMRSGLETTSNRNYGAWVLSRNWIEFALEQPLEDAPGTVMEYSTGNTHLLSAILTAATGRTTLEFARETLAGPLGFRLPDWPRDPQGIYFGGNDMEMTPRQMLAFGELFLNDGQSDGRQVVPRDWVTASLTPRTESRREPGRYYGYGWWIRRTAGFETPYAWGYGGQFIVLVPDIDLVVVTTSSSTPSPERRSQRRQIFDLVEDLVVAPAAAALGAGRGTVLRDAG
jgi:CubicO group peptidase (beta-lactamase class C family)